MEPATILGVLDRLAQADVTVEEAERLIDRLAGSELEALPLVFRRLHDAREPSAVHAAARVLQRWIDLPFAPALPPALRALVAEQGVSDLNRLAAAALLEALDDPMDDAELIERLDDPAALKRQALTTAVDALADPFAAINTLEALAHFPLRDVLHTIDDLARLGDPRAIVLLVPLAHALNGDVAISAVAALDALSALGALDTLAAADGATGLQPVAAAHPDPTVRREAEVTADRLGEAGHLGITAAEDRPTAYSGPIAIVPPANESPTSDSPASGSSGDVPAEIWIGELDESAVLIIARPSRIDPATLDVLTIRTKEKRGIVEYAAAERVAGGLDSVRAAFESAGTPMRRIDVEAAFEHLEAATVRTLESGGGRGYAWAAWRPVLVVDH